MDKDKLQQKVMNKLGNNVVVTGKEFPIETKWNWRNTKEQRGVSIGYCDPIFSNGEERAVEYIPVDFGNGPQLIHRSKVKIVHGRE